MMPTSQTTSSNNKTKLLSKSWWRKLFNNKEKKQKKQKNQKIKATPETQNWRNLSPDEPPLPFLLVKRSIKFSSSEADEYSSELAPISSKDTSTTKDGLLNYFPSPSLYISQPSSSSRELYTIPELSEMNTTATTTRSNSIANNTIKSNLSSVISSTSVIPLPTMLTTSEEELQQQNVTHNIKEGEDEDLLFVSPSLLPQPSSSSSFSLTITPVAHDEEQIENHLQHHQIQPTILIDEEKEEEAEDEYSFKPISEWPSLDSEALKEPQFKDTLQGNELECKLIFSRMLLSAYNKYHQLFYKNRNSVARTITKEMHLIFDEKDNIGGITFILDNGTREDYLQFGGTPQYIPPELSICATYNHEMSDVWALGVSLYRMLVGNYPFVTTTVISHRELFKKMLHSDFRIPHYLSDDAKDLLRRMLAPENARASLDLILFHPWIKSYIVSHNHHDQNVIIEEIQQPQRTKKKSKERKRNRVLRVVKKIVLLVFLGPYPPPKKDAYYHYYTHRQK